MKFGMTISPWDFVPTPEYFKSSFQEFQHDVRSKFSEGGTLTADTK
jgi:hypothetical protein